MESHIIACILGYDQSDYVWNVEMETFLDNIMQPFCIMFVDFFAFVDGEEELKKVFFRSYVYRAVTSGVINTKHLALFWNMTFAREISAGSSKTLKTVISMECSSVNEIALLLLDKTRNR